MKVFADLCRNGRGRKMFWSTVLLFFTFFSMTAVSGQTEGIGGVKKISVLDVREMEIGDVLKIISDTTGWTIIPSQQVKGRVSLWLKDIGAEKALEKILKTNGYAYRKEDNAVLVMSKEEYQQLYGKEMRVFPLQRARAVDIEKVVKNAVSKQGTVAMDGLSNMLVVIDTEENIKRIEAIVQKFDRELETLVFNLNYAIGEDLIGELNKIVGTEQAKTVESILIDKRTNTVAVTASPERIGMVRQLLDSWDEKSRQVSIEAKILLTAARKLENLGSDLAYMYPKMHNLSVAGQFPAGVTSGASFFSFQLGSLTEDQYQAILDALITDTRTELLSNPRVLAVNNQEAVFSVGSDEPYKVITIDPNNAYRTEDIRFARVGVTLKVTPRINKEGFITMKVRPEVSSLLEIREGIPVIEKREAESTVMVEDGKTVIIGGLIRKETTKVVNKIPLLGDIPLLGMLFRSKSVDKSDRELVIFITPHIVNEGKEKSQPVVPPAAKSEDGKT